MASLRQELAEFLRHVEQALDEIPALVDVGHDLDGVLLSAERLLRDTLLVERLLPQEQALTGNRCL